MVITTQNSTYKFKDLGDGVWSMTSNNPKYPGPSLMRFSMRPGVGASFYAQFMNGPKEGRTLISSRIVRIRWRA